MMAFNFKRRYKVAIKNYSSFSKKEIIKAFRKVQERLIINIILILIGISYIAYGIYTIYTLDYKFIFLFAGISFITISIALYAIPFVFSYNANKNILNIEYDLTFYDTYFEVFIIKNLERSELSFNYTNIYKKIKKGNFYYIYINQKEAIILKLDSFKGNDKLKFLEFMKGI